MSPDPTVQPSMAIAFRLSSSMIVRTRVATLPLLFVASFVGMVPARVAFAQTQAQQAPAPVAAAAPADQPFGAEILAFREWDRKNAAPQNGVLFVGSSTIRLWPTAERFPDLPVINRGFGGSQIFEVNHHIEDVVLKYRPAVVVFYAGDNDINAGRTPQQVVDDYRAFTRTVLAARRDTRIIFLAIKPSPARWALWPTMKETNERIRSYSMGYSEGAGARPPLMYAEVALPMLTADGQTQAHLYVEDGLHMSVAGYDLWTKTIAPIIAEALRPAP